MDAPRTPAVLLAGWTLFVWLTRVRNAVGDDDLSGAARIGTLLLSASCVVLAAVSLAGLRAGPASLRRAVGALGLWTVVVWPIRAVGIALGGHGAGFVVVHLALAASSIGLAAWAWRAVGSRRPVVAR